MSADINLLPEKEKRDVTWIMLAGVLLVLFLALFLFFQIAENRQRQEITELNSRQQELTEALEEETDSEGKEAQIQAHRSTLDELKNTVVPASPVIRAVARALPSDGYIQAFDYAYPSTLTVTVELNEVNQSADMQYALGEAAVFEDVTMEALNAYSPSGGNTETTQTPDNQLPRYEAVYEMSVTGIAVREDGEAVAD
ncbi:hypothetical protein [Salibacterium qingdaonense]|uniref:Type IV pilus assembly protein PilN n=1 Tax=Salibacterium qingdaonense TaxID=266892 RepID=A0A1I4MSP2_9BACI|nr:hypothetical protein [Salibacterium qingdaonense]SFM06258.1 hypothetical protein SAMN04488054_11337 [Salibacterium qingdaonense]